ncbi:MAG: glycogen-binding domain-containing protein [Gemmatimonadetes bacterium]|nr:glycogen-binding domain-containing protein [Gemmatimonadota bacterium]
MMSRPLALRTLAGAVVLGLGTAHPAAAQGSVQLQAGGASALPEGPRTEAALYGLAGLRVDWAGTRTSAHATLFGGLASDDLRASDFVSASTGVEAWTGAGTALGIAARASGFRIASPFTYRVAAVRVGPALRVREGRAEATLRTDLGLGHTLTELRRYDGRVRRAERDLWTRGADIEVGWRQSRWAVEGFAGAWSSAGGAFSRGGAALTVGGPRWAVRLEADRWDTPLGDEWLGGVALLVPLGRRATVSASAGRAPPDPLTLVDAGDQGGVLVGWTVATFAGPPPPVVRLSGEPGSRRAVFYLDDLSVRAATLVEVIGDFTAWTPIALDRVGGGWRGEVAVRPGVYHYGFRVDGDWFVPEDMPGNVPDEWGRTNATLVVSEVVEEGGS